MLLNRMRILNFHGGRGRISSPTKNPTQSQGIYGRTSLRCAVVNLMYMSILQVQWSGVQLQT